MGRKEEKELFVARKSLFRPPSWFPHPTPNLRGPGENRQQACSQREGRAEGWREQELGAVDTSIDGGQGVEEEKGTVEREKAREKRDRKTKMQRCIKTQEERESEAGGDRQKLTQRGCSNRQGLFLQPGTQPERWCCRQTGEDSVCQAGPSCAGRAPPAPRGPFPSTSSTLLPTSPPPLQCPCPVPSSVRSWDLRGHLIHMELIHFHLNHLHELP